MAPKWDVPSRWIALPASISTSYTIGWAILTNTHPYLHWIIWWILRSPNLAGILWNKSSIWTRLQQKYRNVNRTQRFNKVMHWHYKWCARFLSISFTVVVVRNTVDDLDDQCMYIKHVWHTSQGERASNGARQVSCSISGFISLLHMSLGDSVHVSPLLLRWKGRYSLPAYIWYTNQLTRIQHKHPMQPHASGVNASRVHLIDRSRALS